MCTILYRLVQCTWGILQTALGAAVFLLHLKEKHFAYHGAVITLWKSKASVSLGMFVFVTDEPNFCEKLKDDYTKEELSRRLLVHEYGHSVQSLILGPLYLLLMGVPSTVWGFSPSLARKRREEQRSYFSFFTEKWANALGEWVTKEKSMEQLCID